MDFSQWLEVFRPFSAVRGLYVCEMLEPLVTAALGELSGDRTMEVLPALETLSLDELKPSGSARDAMESFIIARELLDRPTVVQRRKSQSPPATGSASLSPDE